MLNDFDLYVKLKDEILTFDFGMICVCGQMSRKILKFGQKRLKLWFLFFFILLK